MNAHFARTTVGALLATIAALPTFTAGGGEPTRSKSTDPGPDRQYAGCLGGCLGTGRDR